MKALSALAMILPVTFLGMVAQAVAIDEYQLASRRNMLQSSPFRKNNPHALSVDNERFNNVGPSTDTLHIIDISSNEHLCSGCNACVSVDGILREPIEQGSMVRLTASKFFFTVFDQTIDLCDILTKVKDGPRCPIPAGRIQMRACFPLDKSWTTDISAYLKVSATDAQKRSIFNIAGTAMIESNCPKNVGPGSVVCNQN